MAVDRQQKVKYDFILYRVLNGHYRQRQVMEKYFQLMCMAMRWWERTGKFLHCSLPDLRA